MARSERRVWCVVCGKMEERRENGDLPFDWHVVAVDDRRFFVCPVHLRNAMTERGVIMGWMRAFRAVARRMGRRCW